TEERARRERARVITRGIVGYSPDRSLSRAAFTLGGRLFVSDLTSGHATGRTTELPAHDAAREPGRDPPGATVADLAGRDLAVSASDGSGDRLLAGDDDPDVAWGVAEFVAAEEMDRYRGFWWAPDGSALLASRVDNRPIRIWHIADPSDPSATPQSVRYPAAGTDNAIVTLHVLGLDGSSVEV